MEISTLPTVGGFVRSTGTGSPIPAVGDGLSSGRVLPGTPAQSAHLGTVQAIAFSPSGQLYIATSRQILRMSAAGLLEPIKALITTGPAKGTSLTEFSSIAVAANGNVFALDHLHRLVGLSDPAGRATYVGCKRRRSGGNPAVLQRGAGGQIVADDGPNLLVVRGNRLVTMWSVNQVPGISNFIFMNYFAVTPGGGINADNLGPGFDRYQKSCRSRSVTVTQCGPDQVFVLAADYSAHKGLLRVPPIAGTVGQLPPTTSGLDPLGALGHVVTLLLLGLLTGLLLRGMDQA